MARTVVIVDDQEHFRQLARALLEEDGFAVIGEAGDGSAALETVRRLQPDIVLVDVRLPDRNGVDIARLIRSWRSPPVVVLTSTADYHREASACGAAGFIPKAQLSGVALRASIDGT